MKPGISKSSVDFKTTTHYQIDYGLIHRKWMNAFSNAEANYQAALQNCNFNSCATCVQQVVRIDKNEWRRSSAHLE